MKDLMGIDRSDGLPYYRIVVQSNWNAAFNDRYFSDGDGLAERRYVFIEANRVVDRLRAGNLIVGELGFGTGLTLLALVEAWAAADLPARRVVWYSVDHQLVPAVESVDHLSCFTELCPWLDYFQAGFQALLATPVPQGRLWTGDLRFDQLTIELHLLEADVANFDAILPDQVDLWFLDGHDPAKNPAMWSIEVFQSLRAHSHPGTELSSWTAAGTVKRALREAGFTVIRRPGFGTKRHMIVGHLPNDQ